MFTTLSNRNLFHAVAGIALGTLLATTGVSAQSEGMLNGAVTDFDQTSSVSDNIPTYQSDASENSYVLELDYNDYTSRRIDDLEEAEFAAFEVPEALEVSD